MFYDVAKSSLYCKWTTFALVTHKGQMTKRRKLRFICYSQGSRRENQDKYTSCPLFCSCVTLKFCSIFYDKDFLLQKRSPLKLYSFSGWVWIFRCIAFSAKKRAKIQTWKACSFLFSFFNFCYAFLFIFEYFDSLRGVPWSVYL